VSKCIRLAVFTFFTAFTVMLLVDKVDAMALEGTDENGRHVLVYDVDKYLKKNPYKPPAKKKAVPIKKASAPKPKPAPVPFKPKEVVRRSIIGGTTAAMAVAIPAIPTGEIATIPAAVGGAATGALTYTVEWGYDNLEYGAHQVVRGTKKVAKEYKKVSVLEDPMGKSFPH
jgi:hypothetical protein